MALTQILDKAWKCLLARPKKNGVGMPCGFIRKTGNVQASHCHIYPSLSITIGNLIGTTGIGDIHLQANQIGRVVKSQFLNMLILNLHIVVI